MSCAILCTEAITASVCVCWFSDEMKCASFLESSTVNLIVDNCTSCNTILEIWSAIYSSFAYVLFSRLFSKLNLFITVFPSFCCCNLCCAPLDVSLLCIVLCRFSPVTLWWLTMLFTIFYHSRRHEIIRVSIIFPSSAALIRNSQSIWSSYVSRLNTGILASYRSSCILTTFLCHRPCGTTMRSLVSCELFFLWPVQFELLARTHVYLLLTRPTVKSNGRCLNVLSWSKLFDYFAFNWPLLFSFQLFLFIASKRVQMAEYHGMY